MLSGLALSFGSKLVNDLCDKDSVGVYILVGRRNHVQHDGAFTCVCVLIRSENKNVIKTEVVFLFILKVFLNNLHFLRPNLRVFK